MSASLVRLQAVLLGIVPLDILGRLRDPAAVVCYPLHDGCFERDGNPRTYVLQVHTVPGHGGASFFGCVDRALYESVWEAKWRLPG